MALSLVKGQKISLSKEAGVELTKIAMGLGWDVAQTAPKKSFLGGMFGGGSQEDSIDLDASCIMYDDTNNLVDVVWFRQLASKDGSIVHSGDNRTGEGDGDDETIYVDLNKVPSNIKTLVFTVNSFTGQDFSTVANAFCRIINVQGNSEIAKYDLGSKGNHTGMIMAKVYKHNGEWKMHAIGEVGAGKSFQDMLPQIGGYL